MSEKPLLDPPAKDDSAEVIRGLIPLANAFLENQSAEIAHKHTFEMKSSEFDFQLEKENINLEKFRFNRFFWMLSIVLIFIGAIIWGLVFWIGKIELGISLLSHLGVLILGLLSGMGIQKLRSDDHES